MAASILKPPAPPPPIILNVSSYSISSPRPSLSYPFCITSPFRLRALKTGSDGGSRLERPEAYDQHVLRKPVVSPGKDLAEFMEDRDETEQKANFEDDDQDKWVDWEDKILEDTVPLVGFVRTILHSGKYESGDRLSPEHERTILERLLPFHPEFKRKIGCGVDYLTVGYHPDFESSRCLFIVQKDGKLVDFSYWKCIEGLIRKNYPLYADSFILRHFRRRRRQRY